MLIKILAVVLALLGLRRLIVRYRRGGTLTVEFLTWLLVWSGIGVVVFIPGKTDEFAHWLGVSSGFHALTFLSITGLLFAVYRLLSRVQAVERDITRLVRLGALAAPERVEPPAAASSHS